MMATECAGCLKPILDRFLLHFLDKTWHSNCVKCQLCRKLLDEKCFYKEGKIYCREDFYRCFGPKCGGCGEGIHPQDFVRKAREKVYHLRCFTCSLCSKQLSTGEVLYLQPGDDSFVCKEDYLKTHQDSLFSDEEDELDDQVAIPGMDPSHIISPPHSNPPSDTMSTHSLTPTPSKLETNNNLHIEKPEDIKQEADDDDDVNKEGEDGENKSPNDSEGGGKRRGPRTTIKAKQLEVLKTAFAQTPKPTRHIREQLAKETGLSMRVIQVWFQNKRSKERRLKQMTSGMMSGRGFFPGKGGRRGFPIIGDDFGYFPHDKPPFNDFGYPNFPPGGEFFPPGAGPMGFMGHPGGPGMDQPLPMHGGPSQGPIGPPPNGPPPSEFPPSSMGGDFPMGDLPLPPPRPSPDFQSNSGNGGNFSPSGNSEQMNEQMVW